MAPAPTANDIAVREVLEKLESDFAPAANAVANGEFALWVGSGISRQAPNLGNLIERAFDYIRERAVACLLYTSPSPRDGLLSRMPSSA